jgi:amidase
MFKEYADHDATGLAALVARNEVKPAELLDAALARAEAVEPQLKSICIPMQEIARERVQAFDRRRRHASTAPFAGVPFLLKDISQHYAGVPTTAGSRALRNWCPSEHSTIVQRYLDAGLVIFGKTATPEFALKALTESTLWGATRNPWDLSRTPGGSSGGAAAAVAAGIVPMAGASDGGGSIRIPASFCGLFGLKPSRGRLSLGPQVGEIWDGASTEHVLTRSVRDSARMLDAIAGGAAGDPFAIPAPEWAFAAEIARPPGALRIGFSSRSPIGTAVDEEAVNAVERSARLLASLGHHVEPAEPDYDGLALARCFIGMYFGQVAASIAEAKALTGAGDDDFELETRALGMLGRALSAGEYVGLRKQWNSFARALGRFHQRFDLYLTPTVAMPPSKIGEQALPRVQQAALRVVLRLGAGKALLKTGIVDQLARDSLARVPFTQLSNLTGTPSMSVPLHWSAAGLPVGVQFVARHGEEALLLKLAAQLEAAQPWSGRRPAL